MAVDEKSAASSAVAVEEQPLDIASLTPTERESWRLTGELPVRKAESDPADKDKPAKESTNKTPTDSKSPSASEAEPPDSEDAEPKPTSKAGKRIAQLLGEIKQLRADAEKRNGAPPAAEPKAADKKTDKLRAEPTPNDKKEDGSQKYKTWEEYNADRIEWGVEKVLHERDAKQATAVKDAEVEKANKAIEDGWKAKVAEARKKYSDFDTVALDKDLPIKAGTVVDSFILDSDLGTDVVYYLGQHKDELTKINAMPPWKQARELWRIEASLSNGAATPAKKPDVEVKSASSDAQPTKEVEISKAPRPIREVGGRGGSPADEVSQAEQSGDFRAYSAAMNRRDLVSRKGR